MNKLMIMTPLLLLLGACGGGALVKPQAPPTSPAAASVSLQPDAQALAEFEAEADAPYRLGEGDKINVDVWRRPELAGEHIIGPDGLISMPLIGDVALAGRDREQATRLISERLGEYYKAPLVTLRIDSYNANRISVLGRVMNPGVMQFDRPPLLLDVLARAGAMPVANKELRLSRCAIIRGREKIIHVDIRTLLRQGDLAYNLRLKPNDIVYFPDVQERLAYVLGAVHRPGVYPIGDRGSLLTALASAGGPNSDADTAAVTLHRSGVAAMQFDISGAPDIVATVALDDGDVIHVPQRGMARVGYVLRQLAPGISLLNLVVSSLQIREQMQLQRELQQEINK